MRAGLAVLLLALACGGGCGGGSPTGSDIGCDSSPTILCPGDSLAAKVNAAPEGTAFQLRSGIYRLEQISPKSGQTFTGEPGAILSGARLLTDWSQEGSYWVHAGQTQEGEVRLASSCQQAYPACAYPEDLFVDDSLLQRVPSLGEVITGKWYFDYATDKVYMADVPAGRRVEISVLPWAIYSNASNVTIENLTVEKYASPAQRGAIGYSGVGGGWTVRSNEVRWNHGVGIRTASGMQVLDNVVHHQGQLGIGGSGSGVLVEGNEIAFNNTAGFGAGSQSEAGGRSSSPPMVSWSEAITRTITTARGYGPTSTTSTRCSRTTPSKTTTGAGSSTRSVMPVSSETTRSGATASTFPPKHRPSRSRGRASW